MQDRLCRLGGGANGYFETFHNSLGLVVQRDSLQMQKGATVPIETVFWEVKFWLKINAA